MSNGCKKNMEPLILWKKGNRKSENQAGQAAALAIERSLRDRYGVSIVMDIAPNDLRAHEKKRITALEDLGVKISQDARVNIAHEGGRRVVQTI